MRLRQLVAVTAAIICLSAATAVPAVAATASSSPTGNDPISAGCGNDATTTNLKNFPGSAGYIELRYSPHCRAAWARITSTIEYEPGIQGSGGVEVRRNSDGKTYSCKLPSYVKHPSCYTKMVNDAGVTSYAQGDLDLESSWPTIHTSSY